MDRGIFAEEERGTGKETSDGRRDGQKDPPRSARKEPKKKKKRREKRISSAAHPQAATCIYGHMYLSIHTYTRTPGSHPRIEQALCE